MVVDEGYDKVWMVESDTIPPLDALEKLLAVDAPVVSGLYALRHGSNVPNVWRWGETLNALGGVMSWKDVERDWGKVVRTTGGCQGCVVADRSAIEGFSFILGKEQSPDVPWMEYCFHSGIKMMADLSVICGHKEPNGNILDPRDFVNIN